MDRVRILTSETMPNGDEPFAIVGVVGQGERVYGEYAVLYVRSGQIHVESIQSTLFNSEGSALEQLKVSVLNQFESFRLASNSQSSESIQGLQTKLSLVEQSNAYLYLTQICAVTNGRQRLEFVSENTISSRLKQLIDCAIKDTFHN